MVSKNVFFINYREIFFINYRDNFIEEFYNTMLYVAILLHCDCIDSSLIISSTLLLIVTAFSNNLEQAVLHVFKLLQQLARLCMCTFPVVIIL